MVSLGEYSKIIHLSGPFPGSVNDHRIAKNCSLMKLNEKEKVIADLGYHDKKKA